MAEKYIVGVRNECTIFSVSFSMFPDVEELSVTTDLYISDSNYLFRTHVVTSPFVTFEVGRGRTLFDKSGVFLRDTGD